MGSLGQKWRLVVVVVVVVVVCVCWVWVGGWVGGWGWVVCVWEVCCTFPPFRLIGDQFKSKFLNFNAFYIFSNFSLFHTYLYTFSHNFSF